MIIVKQNVSGKEQSKENIKKDRIIRDIRTPFKQ